VAEVTIMNGACGHANSRFNVAVLVRQEIWRVPEYIVQLAGTERGPVKEVRTLILVKADELGLPVTGEQVAISGIGQTLAVESD
jgi:hypothetical protein